MSRSASACSSCTRPRGRAAAGDGSRARRHTPHAQPGAAVALVAGAVVVVACADDAIPFVRTVVVAPGAAVAALVAALSRLSDPGQLPTHAGWLVAAVTIACAAGTALEASRVPPANRSSRRVPRLTLAVALVIGAIAVVIRTGSTEPRASLWRVAWHHFESHVAFGSGAGTFALAWARSGLIDTRGGALDAHSLYLETLSELGLVGLALLLVFLALPLARPSRLGAGLAPVAAGAYVVFVVHAALDWDWEMPRRDRRALLRAQRSPLGASVGRRQFARPCADRRARTGVRRGLDRRRAELVRARRHASTASPGRAWCSSRRAARRRARARASSSRRVVEQGGSGRRASSAPSAPSMTR